MAKQELDLNAAVAAAYEGSGFDQTQEETDGTAAQTAETAETEGSTEGSTSAQAEVESKTGTEGETETPEAAAAAAATEGTDEPPSKYFEVDLSSLPAEERGKVIAALRERDDEIGKLLRGKAEGEEETPPEPPAAPEPLTDEAILQAMGLDPEDPFDEKAAKMAVPLVRGLQSLQEQVQSLVERSELQALEVEWTTSLDALEKQNGELPVTREAVLEFAAENGILTPEDAYWRIFGPARRQVEQAVVAAQGRVSAAGKTATTKQAASSTRPQGGAATEEVAPTGKTVREATKEVADKLLKELGIGE